MSESKIKSRSMRRVYVKTPGGKVVTHYRKRNPKIAHCGVCRAILHGMPRLRPYKMQNLAKTKKRPERPYGGKLCSKCLKTLMIEKARKEK